MEQSAILADDPKAMAIEEFKSLGEDLKSGHGDGDKFKAARLGLGLYTQRQSEYYMVRTKFPAGEFNARTLRTLADGAEKYSTGSVHLTTRQDVQFYFVKHDLAAELLELLNAGGVTTLGAGGNTIRNIIVCDHFGGEGANILNVRPLAARVSSYFLGHELAKGLPRKMKITFCGHGSRCGGGLTDDIAFVADTGNGAPGFKVYVGGGQGAMPRLGKALDSFVPVARVHATVLAILKVFNRRGTRVNRSRARLKFLIEKIGLEKFRELYRRELASLDDLEPLDIDLAKLVPVQGNHAGGMIIIKVPTGDLTSDQLRSFANILEDNPDVSLRATKNADLLLSGFGTSDEQGYRSRVNTLGLEALPDEPASYVTSCNGASTCNEGITNSKALASRLEKIVSGDNGGLKLSVSISGCPNSCGNHHTADIGFQGSARKINDTLVPHYQVYIGGSVRGDNPGFATALSRIPAKRVPEALESVINFIREEKKHGESAQETIKRLGAGRFEAKLEYFSTLGEREKDRDSYLDFDSDKEFSLEGIGPGECAGSALDIIDGYFTQARRDIAAARQESDAAAIMLFSHNAAIAGARALLVTYGVDPSSDEETSKEFFSRIISRGFVPETYQVVLEGLGNVKNPEAGVASERLALAEKFIDACLAAYSRINAKTNVEEEKHETSEVERMDLSGVACPFNYVKIKLALENLPSGDVIEALVDDGSPIRNVPKSLLNDGHKILSTKPVDGQYLLTIEKG